MDPYLESRWSDVHVRLVSFASEALQPMLPPALRARSEERVLLESVDDTSPQSWRSDVAVIDTGRRGTTTPASGSAATLEPLVVQFYDAPQIDRFVRIIDVTNGNRVVTVIEILSPWNKAPGRLNADYHRKLDDYARAEVNLVKIDLLRHPPRGRLTVTEADIPANRRAPYLVCVRPAQTPDRWLVYPLSLRLPLPAIPIPLRPGDNPVDLPLQPLIDRVYAAGGHDDIDYCKPPSPPLEPDDAAWADEFLRRAGKR